MTPYYDRDGVVIYHGDCLDILPQLEPVDHVITVASIEGVDLHAALSLCHPLRWTVATVDWRFAHSLETCPPTGQRFVRLGVWIKPDGAPQFTGDRPATGWEAVAVLHREGGRMRWNGGGDRAVWTHNIVRGGHPTEKPIELLRDFVLLFTDPSDTILDPFAGSGTTGRAAMDLGRKAILIEKEERWCEVAAKRMAQGVLL